MNYNYKIIVEGIDRGLDWRIVNRLIKESSIDINLSGEGNIEDIKKYLNKVHLATDFSVLAVIVDLDEKTISERFKELLACVQSNYFNKPNNVGEITQPEYDKKGLGFFFFPNNKENGSVDSLVYKTLNKKYESIKKCPEKFLTCFQENGMYKNITYNQKSKFYINTIIRGIGASNKSEHQFLDFNHSEFDPLKRFLRQIDSSV